MTKPKPIVDPHAGQLQVVVSFRVEESLDPERARRSLARTLPHVWGWAMHDLTVHVRVIGAQGEKAEDEGLWPALAEDVERVNPRDRQDIDVRGERL